ncbi:hypothetical protein DMB42_18905 [Nonomuraea sp. WAC 01424]|nr:hypothetical protein DMB42_18905 [Nonomuraea sp. WAC 01424]
MPAKKRRSSSGSTAYGLVAGFVGPCRGESGSGREVIAVKVDTFRLLANSAGETVVLHPAGDLDLHTAGAIEAWATGYLDGRPAAVTLIDLSDVGFMDSAGLGALIGAWKRITATGRTVMVAAPTPQPARLMRITGLEGRLGVRATVAEALEEVIPRRSHAPA